MVDLVVEADGGRLVRIARGQFNVDLSVRTSSSYERFECSVFLYRRQAIVSTRNDTRSNRKERWGNFDEPSKHRLHTGLQTRKVRLKARSKVKNVDSLSFGPLNFTKNSQVESPTIVTSWSFIILRNKLNRKSAFVNVRLGKFSFSCRTSEIKRVGKPLTTS